MIRKPILILTVLILAGTVAAWHGPGHVALTRSAVEALPESMPAFFRQGGGAISHVSVDPDLFRLKENPQLRDEEVPDHFFDLELLGDAKLPPTRYEFIRLCAGKSLDPAKVGMLPYAITEWTGRLTVAFAEYRRWPDDPAIQCKCMVYAGLLAHYAQDLENPLHTTVDYDGRGPAQAGKGIHSRVDGAIQSISSSPAEPRRLEKVLPAVWEELLASHKLVDRVYELDKEIPAEGQPLPEQGPASEFFRERYRSAASFTASLYWTAWCDSEKFPLPEWHKR